MKYALEKVTKCSGRIGTLSGIDRLPNINLRTPALVLHSKGGSIPHLSKEVLQYMNLEPTVIQYSLANTENMEEAIRASGNGISYFVAQPEMISLLTLQDPAEFCQPNFHEKDLVPIYCRRGRRNFTVEQYMELVEAFQPDVFVPLFDGYTDEISSKKRVQKSVERTETLVEQFLEERKKSGKLGQSTILAPLVGGYNINLREKYSKFISRFEHDFSGYLIAGLHSNGSTASKIEQKSLLEIVSKICELLPSGKPRFAFGAFNPNAILEMISCGVDVFDTSYPYLKTQQHRALVFSFNVDEKEVDDRETELDLTDSRWAQDFTGFVSSCACLACTKHTRAYSQHLFNTREMLGPILLMIHNLHHFFEFFKVIQKHVVNDTLPDLQNHLKKQKLVPYEEKEASKDSKADGKFVKSTELNPDELRPKKLKI
ncbi:queuine tRNA-ribosyltransferase accessory subunit 2 [Topomyia yanbarensis]|uniref:queuine tRNA-ribosyltransferase accessory subunit 2 n=1 Tax=Topomyia yanbarensis TaxID=2498891 RepID=UPI00273CA14D|nr:queuine tRNA-ribosyltransferase accessory subunit 2 [Topomyia yanbarensis]